MKLSSPKLDAYCNEFTWFQQAMLMWSDSTDALSVFYPVDRVMRCMAEFS